MDQKQHIQIKLDQLDFKGQNQKYLKDGLEQYETVLLSMELIIYESNKQTKERILVITNKNVLNIKKRKLMGTLHLMGTFKIERKNSIDQIKGVVISKNCNEFTFVIPSSYDYRYESENKDVILEILLKAYEFSQKKKLPFYYVNNYNLEDYTTTKKNVQNSQSNIPDPREVETIQMTFSLYHKKYKKREENQSSLKVEMIFNKNKENQKSLKPCDFKLVKTLGEGAFGKVLAVRQKETDELYAMKKMYKSQIIADKFVKYIQNERKIMEKTAMNHPFLVGIEFAFQTKNSLYLGMKFLKGGDFFTLLDQKQRQDPHDIIFYTANIALAIGHLHKNNIIHRDIKPENILVDDEGYLSITDFGTSTFVTKNMPHNTFMGTMNYLSPEMVLGFNHSYTTDWWALGCLIYEMTVGIPPFYDNNQNKIAKKICRQKVAYPSEQYLKINPKLKSLINSLLHKNKQHRLGAKNGFEEVKNHPFFEGYKWSDLYAKKLKAPFIPDTKGNNWKQYFEDLTDSNILGQSIAESNAEKYEKLFKNYEFKQEIEDQIDTIEELKEEYVLNQEEEKPIKPNIRDKTDGNYLSKLIKLKCKQQKQNNIINTTNNMFNFEILNEEKKECKQENQTREIQVLQNKNNHLKENKRKIIRKDTNQTTEYSTDQQEEIS